MLTPHIPALRGDRDVLMLKIPPKKENTIKNQMCVYWNDLPQNIRLSETVVRFYKRTENSLQYFTDAFYEAPCNSDTDSDFDDIDN